MCSKLLQAGHFILADLLGGTQSPGPSLLGYIASFGTKKQKTKHRDFCPITERIYALQKPATTTQPSEGWGGGRTICTEKRRPPTIPEENFVWELKISLFNL